LQAIADDIGVRQFALMWQAFPRGVIQRRMPEPGFEVLLRSFLGFGIRCHDDQGMLWKKPGEQRREERLGGSAHAGTGQHAARLQTPPQGLGGGSGGKVGEPGTGRRR